LNGQARSWDQFVRHRWQLLRYVQSLIASREDAADLSQELGVVVLAHDDAPADAREFLHWCRGIAHNLALHHWRAERRYNHLFADWEADPNPPEAVALSLEETLADRQTLKRCVADLDEASRELIKLRYVDGKTSREIARIVRQSPDAVRMRIMRVREALRDRLCYPEAPPPDRDNLHDSGAH